MPQVLLMKRMPDAIGGVARKVPLLQVLLTKRPPDAVGGVAKEVLLLQVLLMKRPTNAVGGVAKEVAVAHVQIHACLGASLGSPCMCLDGLADMTSFGAAVSCCLLSVFRPHAVSEASCGWLRESEPNATLLWCSTSHEHG